MKDQIFLTRSSLPSFEEYVDEIKSMWDSHWITTMGPKHDQFEEKLQSYLEVENVSVFVNGHNALELIIQAMELTGEVITTPYSFISTTHAIVRNKLTPVFCDINKHDYTIDANKIEELITEKTSAIISVHVYGNICDVEKIHTIAKKHGLKVIYNAAHCFGEKYKGESVASFGDASIYSFHASKVFNSIEGGCVAYANPDIKEKLFALRNFGISGGGAEYVGTNAKMNEFVAAMGICNLRHIDKAIEKRKSLYHLYIDLLSDLPGIIFNYEDKDLERNYSYFPIRISFEKYPEKRDQIYNDLNKKGIQVLCNFYPIIPKHPCYQKYKTWEPTPIAEKISKEILLLPLYEDLPFEQVEYICENFRDALLK